MTSLAHRSLLIAVVAAPVAAQAGEVCVVCADPGAVYRCIADPKLPAFRGSDKVLQYICVTELAKSGGHASCKVSGNGGEQCQGVERIVGSQGIEPPAPTQEVQAPPPVPQPEQKDNPPKTLVDLAKRTKEQMDDDTRKTGQAVGGAFKKTWDCVATLFKQC